MSIFKRWRSAISGRFVRRSEAAASPATTVSETVRTPTAQDLLAAKAARAKTGRLLQGTADEGESGAADD